jgi:hypothetical protein
MATGVKIKTKYLIADEDLERAKAFTSGTGV